MLFLYFKSLNLQNIRTPHHLVEIIQIKNRLNTKALKEMTLKCEDKGEFMRKSLHRKQKNSLYIK